MVNKTQYCETAAFAHNIAWNWTMHANAKCAPFTLDSHGKFSILTWSHRHNAMMGTLYTILQHVKIECTIRKIC